MDTESLNKKLDELWEESHSKTAENPTAAFIEYCRVVLDAYKQEILDSEQAGYKHCGEFNPEVSFKETKESEEIHEIACDLELPSDVQSNAKTVEEKWQKIEELVAMYEDSSANV